MWTIAAVWRHACACGESEVYLPHWLSSPLHTKVKFFGQNIRIKSRRSFSTCRLISLYTPWLKFRMFGFVSFVNLAWGNWLPDQSNEGSTGFHWCRKVGKTSEQLINFVAQHPVSQLQLLNEIIKLFLLSSVFQHRVYSSFLFPWHHVYEY